MAWKPHVTVAAVIEQAGKFLVVEEEIEGKICYNQPAGHLEENETLLDAVVREVKEETAYDFEPERLIGIYHWRNANNQVTFVRFVFSGSVSGYDPTQPLDKEIVTTHWFSQDELKENQTKLRSPLVMRAFEDWANGKSYPLDLVSHLA